MGTEFVKFTRRQREKLQRLGYRKVGNSDVVRSGFGKYTKDFDNAHVSIMIRDHEIKRFQFSLLYQGTDSEFVNRECSGVLEAMKEINELGYFNAN